MDPLSRAQIILLCDLCKTTHLQSHCERCDINLCKVCVGEHLSDTSIRHKVVPYKYRKSLIFSKCPDHADEHCKYYCEKCDIPVCSNCVSSSKHKDHNTSDILKKVSAQTQCLQKDLEELETRIYPQYEEMSSSVQIEKAYLEMNYWKLTTATEQQGEILHREITSIVNERKSAIQEMKNKHLSTLNKSTEEITQKMTELKHTIADLKSILKSSNVSLTSTYQSRNPEFGRLSPKILATLPTLSPQKINRDQLNEMFGSLSSLSINTEEFDTINPLEAAVSSSPIKPLKTSEVVSSPSAKQLLDEPRFNATIATGNDRLYTVSCLSEEQVWTCGNTEIMKLFNLQGKLLASIQTKSGHYPEDIAVTRVGDLVYTDFNNRTVNIVKNKHIQAVITSHGWSYLSVCNTTSDDLLVTMISDDRKQSKVVRYSGSTETQSIQFDDQGCPLYSSGGYIEKHVNENRNLDICVADQGASAIVVVNQSGKLRFRYTGHPSNADESFYPRGIATDSQSHILTADNYNGRIHILDQDGQFLRFIYHLRWPWGLCVDLKDNLFVAECDTAKVKKIQYLYA